MEYYFYHLFQTKNASFFSGMHDEATDDELIAEASNLSVPLIEYDTEVISHTHSHS